jgi:hypothetical protein
MDGNFPMVSAAFCCGLLHGGVRTVRRYGSLADI